MKAVVCVEPGKIVIEDREDPEHRDDWVKLRVRRVGICGTDFHIYKGQHPFLEYPRVMGHELSGEVLSVPVGSSLKIGEPVIVNPYLPCGECITCRKGKFNCCVNIEVLGVHADGGMCEYIYVPEAALYSAEGLTLSQAAMVEFLSIGAHGVRRGEVKPGDRVLVVGAGPIGLGAAIFLSLIDDVKVAVLDLSAERVATAMEIIPMAQGIVGGDGALAAMQTFTDGEMFDVVFDATGNKYAMESSINYVAHGGSCVFISVIKEDISFSDPSFHSRELRLIGSRNATREDFHYVISCIKEGKVPTDQLNTHEASLEELPDKIPQWLADNNGLIKAIACL
ncbi:MAG: zinc-binding alcohol dehydrogenase family protein [Pseudomonadales bacterium]